MAKVVFIVDDDPIYRMIVSRMLRKFDTSLKIKECGNGKKGLESLRYYENSNDEIIVLLDINMPVIAGWGFLNELEKCDFYDIEKLRLFMVSSSTDDDDVAMSNQFKFVKRLFHKPLSEENIKVVLGISETN